MINCRPSICLKLLIPLFLMVFLMPLQSLPRNPVLVELFTSTTCTACPGAAMGAHDLITNGHPVAVITHHVNDPFTNLSAIGRRQFYDTAGTPVAFFDGLDPCPDASYGVSLYPEYLSRVNSRLAIPACYRIEADGAADSLSFSTTVIITKAEADTTSTAMLFATVTESGITYDWLNQTSVENVNRMMIPDHNGTPVELGSLGVGDSLVLTLDYNVKHDWQMANCALVLWLQDPASNEVLHTAQYTLQELGGVPYVNQAPVLSLPESFGMYVNDQLRLDFDQYVSDQENDALLLSSPGSENLEVLIDGLDVTIIPDSEWYGNQNLSFSVFDGVNTVNTIIRIEVYNLLPPVLHAQRRGQELILQWNAVPQALCYLIYASGDADGQFSLLATVQETEWRENIAPSDRARFYTVKASTRR